MTEQLDSKGFLQFCNRFFKKKHLDLCFDAPLLTGNAEAQYLCWPVARKEMTTPSHIIIRMACDISEGKANGVEMNHLSLIRRSWTPKQVAKYCDAAQTFLRPV